MGNIVDSVATSNMYQPPPPPSFSSELVSPIVKFKDISYAIFEGGKKPELSTIRLSILFLHGNQQDIISCVPFANEMVSHLESGFKEGYDVFIQFIVVDYPMYGESEKNDKILGTKELDRQIDLLYKELTANSDYDVVIGYSIGTRYSCQLAKTTHLSSLDLMILLAPYFSLPENLNLLTASLLKYGNNPLATSGMNLLDEEFLKSTSLPIHIIAAENDEVIPVPPKDTPEYQNYIRCASNIEIVPGKDHNWFAKSKEAPPLIAKVIVDYIVTEINSSPWFSLALAALKDDDIEGGDESPSPLSEKEERTEEQLVERVEDVEKEEEEESES